MDKYLFIANSQGSFADTDGLPYTCILQDKISNSFYYIKSGLTIDDVILNYNDIFLINKPSIVVINLGIVEISERILSDKSKRYLYYLPFGKYITKFIWKYKCLFMLFKNKIGIKNFQKLSNIDYVNKICLLTDKLKRDNMIVYILTIPLLPDSYLKNIFFNANKNIENVNNLLLSKFKYGGGGKFVGY